MLIDNGTRKMYVEPIGKSSKITDARIMALLAAAAIQVAAGVEQKKTDPTPEEMLAIGLAIGMCEANRGKEARSPRPSMWKMAARLGI